MEVSKKSELSLVNGSTAEEKLAAKLAPGAGKDDDEEEEEEDGESGHSSGAHSSSAESESEGSVDGDAKKAEKPKVWCCKTRAHGRWSTRRAGR